MLRLTPREIETCWLLANEGMTDRQLAERMGLSQLTAKQYVAHAMRKLGFESRAQLIVWIWQHGNIVQINDLRFVELVRGDTTGYHGEDEADEVGRSDTGEVG